MVDGVSGVAEKPPITVQPTQQSPQKPANRSAEVRHAEQKVESTFDFEALAEAVGRVQEYSDMVSVRALPFLISHYFNRSAITEVNSVA